jgi:ABC-type transporter Mla subunit MlaD
MRALLALLRARLAGRSAEKSVSSVLGSFDNLVAQLDRATDQLHREHRANDTAIHRLVERNEEIDIAASRAQRVRNRIADLLD